MSKTSSALHRLASMFQFDNSPHQSYLTKPQFFFLRFIVASHILIGTINFLWGLLGFFILAAGLIPYLLVCALVRDFNGLDKVIVAPLFALPISIFGFLDIGSGLFLLSARNHKSCCFRLAIASGIRILYFFTLGQAGYLPIPKWSNPVLIPLLLCCLAWIILHRAHNRENQN